MLRVCLSFGLLMLAVSTGFAQRELDLGNLKSDTLVFERILDERLKLGFSDPFAVTGSPTAFYLRGYGVVVSFQLNISRYRVRTPFGDIQSPMQGQFSKQKKEEQVRKVRDIAVDCLADYSSAIKQLNAHDRISISAHIEDRNELDPAKRITILVVTTSKDDVDLLAMRKTSVDEFRKNVSVVEY